MGGNVEDFIKITKLNPSKDMEALEKGVGCLWNEDGNTNAYYHNGSPVRYLAYLEFAPNVWRGNHYHREKEENMCVIKGSLKARYWLPDEPEGAVEVALGAGDCVNIKPGLAHNYISEAGAVCVEFSPNNFTASDVMKVRG